MTDKLEYMGASLIHHGGENNRVYLMKLSKEDTENIISKMEKLAAKEGYTKIFAKVPASVESSFLKNNFTTEARVEKFFKGDEECCFLSKFYAQERKELADKKEILNIVELCLNKAKISKQHTLKEGFSLKALKEEHIAQMTQVYKNVFKSYPFPIFQEEHILKTMQENVDYFGVFYGSELVALSSCEMDQKNQNAEMTDFATLPLYRGNNLAFHLLEEMEKSAKEKGIKTVYTIARSKSAAMNLVFAKNFYKFGGMLVNNTNICGKIETMNVWHKSLS